MQQWGAVGGRAGGRADIVSTGHSAVSVQQNTRRTVAR